MQYFQRIRDTREDLDLSQKQIAEELGIDQSYYSKYELGKRPLPINHLITICKYLNISADYILGFTDEPKPIFNKKSPQSVIKSNKI